MSITLEGTPPQYAFSGDQIRAKFAIPDVYSVAGVKAVNTVPISSTPAENSTITLTYGGNTIVMTAKNSPDNSGFQFQASSFPVSAGLQIGHFEGNYLLSRDFVITSSASNLIFTARKEGTGYNMSGFNTTAGVTPVIKPRLSIRFTLYCENAANDGFDNIYETSLNVKVAGTGTAEAIINDKLHNYIFSEIRNNMPDIPGNDPLVCKKSCRRYYFEYAESYGDPVVVRKRFKSGIFTVLHGGLSTLGQATTSLPELISPDTIELDRFLKQGSGTVDTRTDQAQYLYYFNTRATKDVKLMVKYYFTDGSVATINPYSISAPELRKIGFNVGFDRLFVSGDFPVKTVAKYEVWLTDSASVTISRSWFYHLDYEYRQFHRYFLNWSSWGTFDSRMFYGKGSTEFDLVQAVAERSDFQASDISKGSSLAFNKKITTKFAITTGFIKSRTLLLSNRDLFLSNLIYIPSQGKLLPVMIASKNIKELTDGNNLYAQQFEYQYLYDDHAYTEGDVFKEIPPEPFIPGDVYFGPAATLPLTEADVLALPSHHAASVALWTLMTGMNKIIVVALPPGKDIGNIYSNTADEDLTENYRLRSEIDVAGQTYKIKALVLGVAYTSNQDHIITTINV